MTPAMCRILAGVILALGVHHAAFASSPASFPTPPSAPAPITFAVGDKLEVSFYEPLDADPKWAALGREHEPGPSFYLHTELSGDYTVASDWTISVPLLGNVVVAHHTAAEIEATLGKDFTKAVGHPGFVNISILQRNPLYIIGFVNRPGVYAFEPDMTPLNLVALAGGYKTTSPSDLGSGIETIQETAKQIATIDQLSHALAQRAVLKAQIDSTAPAPSEQLIDLVGKPGADALVRQEQVQHMALLQVQTTQLKALQIAVDTAESTVAIDQGRLQPTEEAIAVRLARLSSLSTLSREGWASQLQLDDGQLSVSDSQDRQQNVLSSIAEDKRQLAVAKVEIAEFVADTEMNLNKQMDQRQREIDDLTPMVAADADVIKLLALQGAPGSSGAMKFSIVRDGHLVAASVTTGLQPGDVLQVETQAPTPSSMIEPSAVAPWGTASLQQSSW